MILKEYRILLPLTVEEYRIAQLYMIAKKSRLDSRGSGSGVEIVRNEPFTDGPGGASGQYTFKIYQIGNHLPSVMPRSALSVEEEAWNAYPYTKTRYSCPFVERLTLDIETRYYNDSGTQNNVFGLRGNDLRDRVVDYMNIVLDEVSAMHYVPEEDPRKYQSKKTGRGPLIDEWVDDCVVNKKPIMCAYKLCRVEFRYWGLQSRIENFIHDVALRRTMVHAHRQAWAWQDEWYGMSMEDIRKMEKETKRLLSQIMAGDDENTITDGATGDDEATTPVGEDAVVPDATPSRRLSTYAAQARQQQAQHQQQLYGTHRHRSDTLTSLHASVDHRIGFVSPSGSQRSISSCFDAIANDADTMSIYYDAEEGEEEQRHALERTNSMIRWNSMETVDDELCTPPGSPTTRTASTPCATALLILVFHAGTPIDGADSGGKSAKISDVQTMRSTMQRVMQTTHPQLVDRVVIRLVPCANYANAALNALQAVSPWSHMNDIDISSGVCHPALVANLAAHSSSYVDALSAAIQTANHVYDDFTTSDVGTNFNGEIYVCGDALGGLLAYDMLRGTTPNIDTSHLAVSRHTSNVSSASQSIPEGEVDELTNTPVSRFSMAHARRSSSLSDAGSECSLSSVRVAQHYHATLNAANAGHAEHSHSVSPYRKESGDPYDGTPTRVNGISSHARRGGAATHLPVALFTTHTLFLFGSPLASVLLQRRAGVGEGEEDVPMCTQVFNMYYSIDPCASRLEPLISQYTQHMSCVHVPRYIRHPLGDGQTLDVQSHIKSNRDVLLAAMPPIDTVAGSSAKSATAIQHATMASIMAEMSRRWWGPQRIDLSLYCPDGVAQFPSHTIPTLLHAAYWESTDVCAFLLRHFVCAHSTGDDTQSTRIISADSGTPASVQMRRRPPLTQRGSALCITAPTEKWIRKRTSFKIKNASANHRANDVVVSENCEQSVVGRFMYGPFDVVTLSGEKVDVYVRSDTSTVASVASDVAVTNKSSTSSHATCSTAEEDDEDPEWTLVGTEVSDTSGRVTFTIPREHRLPLGVHSVKMVVRGDRTFLDMFVAVVPPDTDAVVFSIDGSFTASMSVTGRDPKVRAGAVDIVRHWQDRGYLILYVTARPDMQQRQVVSWLAQHNFPHGLLFFIGGISTDPLKHKAAHLHRLITECSIKMHAGYGSAKDVSVYQSANLTRERIFVVGKCGRRLQQDCTHLVDGYSAHLTQLTHNAHMSQVLCPPAHANARLVLRKAFFAAVPAKYYRKPVSVHRSHSFTPRSGKYTSSRHFLPSSATAEGGVVASANSPKLVRGLSPFRFNRS